MCARCRCGIIVEIEELRYAYLLSHKQPSLDYSRGAPYVDFDCEKCRTNRRSDGEDFAGLWEGVFWGGEAGGARDDEEGKGEGREGKGGSFWILSLGGKKRFVRRMYKFSIFDIRFERKKKKRRVCEYVTMHLAGKIFHGGSFFSRVGKKGALPFRFCFFGGGFGSC